MSRTRRTVHIPIVRPNRGQADHDGHEDRLIEIYTQHHALEALTKSEEEQVLSTDAKALDKDWDQVAAPLRKVGLYRAGCAAASAARKVGIAPPLTALYQRISRLAWIEGQRLQSAAGNGPSEGRSAELGLALVLFMSASGSHDQQIIATGALGGQPQGVSDDDVEVLPVGSVPEKLKLVETLARSKALPRFDERRKLLFFLPRQFEQDGEWRETTSLPEVDELADLGVRVIPVDRLSEAVAILNARRSRHLFFDHLAQAAMIAVLAFGVAGFAWSQLSARPDIPIRFLSGGGLALSPEPYHVCFAKDGGYDPIPLTRNGIGKSLPAGETLGWRVQVGDLPAKEGLVAGWFAPKTYRVAQAMISEHSSVKVIVPQAPGGGPLELAPGDIWEWGWQLNGTAEDNSLVLLAMADKSLNADELRSELVDKFPKALGSAPGTEGLDVTAAANYLAAKAMGAAKFTIQTTEGTSLCEP
ncbi:MAG: hypothetical protein ACR2Q4_11320 [Geminicoccaceae bacterium]